MGYSLSYSVDYNIGLFDLMIWFSQHISHETHFQQSSNNAQCGNESWLQTFVMWAAQQVIRLLHYMLHLNLSFPHISHSSLRGVQREMKGKKCFCYNKLPGDFNSRAQWSVRTDESQGKMGGNVWCPTMPISFGRRCRGQGVEVRKPL